MSSTEYPRATWPKEFSEHDSLEMRAKGYINLRIAVAPGVSHTLYFTDPVRLGQDVDAELRQGYPCFDQPGLVIVPEVTVENIDKAVPYLWRSGFFSRLRPDEGAVTYG